jgi:hypothetical protein
MTTIANATKFNDNNAGTNCILAIHPQYILANPVKSKNSMVTATTLIIANVILIRFNMEINY